jgi:hypothetical protein
MEIALRDTRPQGDFSFRITIQYRYADVGGGVYNNGGTLTVMGSERDRQGMERFR